MFYLIYISTAVDLMKHEDLLSILSNSRANNHRDETTGILLYSEGVFMQALEGSEEMVMALYKKIEQDQRHKNMIMPNLTISKKEPSPNGQWLFTA